VEGCVVSELFLFDCGMVGPLPAALSALPNLTVLNISWNELTGTLDIASLGLQALEHADFSENWLSGSLPGASSASTAVHIQGVTGKAAPRHLTDLSDTTFSALRSLILSSNLFSDSIPSELGLMFPNLQVYSVSGNTIQGSLPASVGMLAITSLDLSDSSLTGQLPYISSLIELDVSYNALTGPLPPFPLHAEVFILMGNDFDATLPALPSNLTYLDIRSLQLTGQLPQLPISLEVLLAESNHFTGSILLSTKMISVWIANNYFSGSLPLLPASISSINATTNYFSGTIHDIYECDQCQIDVGKNYLSGQLPNLSAEVRSFSVTRNLFSGSLPNCFNDTAFLNNSSLQILDVTDNPGLGGVIPGTLKAMSELLVVSTSGCDFICYEPIYPPTAYFDFQSEYSITDYIVVPAYNVCRTTEIDALCSVGSSLQVASNLPAESVYLVESVPVISEMDCYDRTWLYSVRDETSSFSHFDVTFSSKTLVGFYPFYVGWGIVLRFCCAASQSSNKVCTSFGVNELPGVGLQKKFSGHCPVLEFNFTMWTDDGSMSAHYCPAGRQSLATLLFTVDRYAFHNPWDCDEDKLAVSNPCTWLGTCYSQTFVFVLQCDYFCQV
jgi:hypothetical protein